MSNPIIRVVDLHHFQGDFVYVGRPMRGFADERIRLGSILGNPFRPVGGMTIDECLRRYRQEIEASPASLAELHRIAALGLPLGCWCCEWSSDADDGVRMCHGQVLADIILGR